MKSPFRSQPKITQSFGARPEYYSQFGLKAHEGLDLIPTGTVWDVLCLEDGVVVKDEDNRGSGAYGVFVTIWHPTIKKATQYCHLESNVVNNQDNVKKGQLLGKMGASGNTQGAHLHLNLYDVDDNGVRLNRNNGYNGGTDPLPFLQESEDTQKIIDDLRNERDKNWNLYQAEQAKVVILDEEKRKLSEQLETTKTLNQTLSNQISEMEGEDAEAVRAKIEAEDKLKKAEIELELFRKIMGLPDNATSKDVEKKWNEVNQPRDEVIDHFTKLLNQVWPNIIRRYKQNHWFRSIYEKIHSFLQNLRG